LNKYVNLLKNFLWGFFIKFYGWVAQMARLAELKLGFSEAG
jgi:hypothetical protein